MFDLEQISNKYPHDYNNVMNTVLVQEMKRYNKLLDVIQSSLENLEKAIQGSAAMTPYLEAISNSLTNKRCPAVWSLVSYPSLKPLGSYINDFLKRIQFLQVFI